MTGRNLAFLIAFSIVSLTARADLGHTVSGDDDTEDSLENSKIKGDSPYLVDGEALDSVENSKPTGPDYIFNHGVKEVSGNIPAKKQYEDVGYTSPGTFENQENYIEVDKLAMAKDFRKVSDGGINITFIKDDFTYDSNNDVINRTITSGAKSVKGGALYFRNDDYIMRSDFLNFHWSLGAAVGYNSGKGIFAVDGTRSETKFSLWEVPVDLGVGLEIPILSWFKISGTGGPSVLGLLQNRSDYQRGEKGKRKFQFSPGYFANAQLKINLTNLSDETAYDLFTSSQITNLYLNLEARHQSYSNFQDEIRIQGTSFGIGFTFEYL